MDGDLKECVHARVWYGRTFRVPEILTEFYRQRLEIS